MRSVKRAAVYDVPPTWQVLSEGTIVGYEGKDGAPRVGASGAAEFGEGACGSQNTNLALAAVKHDTSTDLTDVSNIWARAWADAAYRDDTDRAPQVTLGPPQTITTTTGKQAVIVKATATPATTTGACQIQRGAAYVVTATGFRGELGPTVSLIIIADEAITGAQPVPEAEIRQILPTLRPER